MNTPFSTIEELPDFDIEFPDDYIEETGPTEEDMARADRILDNCDCFYCSDHEEQEIMAEEDWAL
tara:strand:- start:1125 stop:1319 length:195 start_codon:yes stop_codon:yes gene_type:complete